ncbi:MAG: hypothetical protein IJP80_08095 [Bacteroidales bacterium]|nr:hypothetical protein [Bacteroidales bacterium]
MNNNKKDKNTDNNQQKKNFREKNQHEEKTVSGAVPETADDDVASAEEIEEFIRSRKKEREAGRRHDYHQPDDEVPTDFAANESAMDPYLEPDPTLPKVVYKEPLYLSRGCNRCPEAYVPVTETELRSCCKVGSCNWMKDIRQPMEKPFSCVEVRFKNNRKEFFRLPDGIDVSDGDVVAVEGIPGHDVGIVSLTGEVCRIQMLKKKVNPESENIKKLFRRAKASDIERWTAAIKDEESTLKKSRHIAEEQGLSMKVNDVEFQGDHSKAIFYYTADDRVDFRNLIKVLADQFHVRIEMKQIGVRQEAGKVGGLGTCGRELCCSTWLTNFKSVTTGVAKAQQILPNPQKLAGQCGKLKCCLNFEYPVYVDALKDFPPANTPIRFKKGLALYRKTDVFRRIMWYVYEGQNDLYALKVDDVKKLIEMNRNQQYPEQLEDYVVELMSTAALEQESNAAEFEREIQLLADDGTSSSGAGRADNEGGKQYSSGERKAGNGKRRTENGERRAENRSRGPRDNNRSRGPHDNNRQRQPRGNNPKNDKT